MARGHEETLRRVYRLWDEQNFDDMRELVDPDGTFDVSRNVFNPGVHRGLDGFREFARGINEIWENFQVVPEEFTKVGDSVVVTHRISGRGRDTGVDAEMRLFAVCAFRDGKILRFTGGFREKGDALRAAEALE